MENQQLIEVAFPKTTEGRLKYTAASKATIDIRKILEERGVFVNVVTRRFIQPSIGTIEIFIKILFQIAKKGKKYWTFYQYPSMNIQAFRYLKSFLSKGRNIAIVHDLQTYRFANLQKFRKSEISILNSFDYLVVHTPSMKERLVKDGLKTKIIILNAFDYLLNGTDNYAVRKKNVIVFAGNLLKSEFLSELNEINFKTFSFNLYGAQQIPFITNNHIHYCGCFSPNCVSQIEGEWGLVWDGTSAETCTGLFGEYLQLIAPHKLSLYISSGLKVIIWNKSAMRDFVIDNKLGIAIDRLHDLETVIGNISDEDIKQMDESIAVWSEKLRNGEMFTNAISKIQSVE